MYSPPVLAGAISLIAIGALIGAVYTFMQRDAPDEAIRRRVVQTPTTPIAAARGDGVVEIHGAVEASEGGVATTPVGGRQAVRYSVRIYEMHQDGDIELDAQHVRHPFLVDDGSGEKALVAADPARWEIVPDRYGSSGSTPVPRVRVVTDTLTDDMRAYVRRRVGRDVADAYIEEEVIAPGDPVYALAPSERRAGGAYRDRPGLILHAGGEGDDELILSNMTEADLLARLGVYRSVRRLLLVIAVLFVVGGAAWLALL